MRIIVDPMLSAEYAIQAIKTDAFSKGEIPNTMYIAELVNALYQWDNHVLPVLDYMRRVSEICWQHEFEIDFRFSQDDEHSINIYIDGRFTRIILYTMYNTTIVFVKHSTI